jgi:hypothetical protein
MMALMAKLPGSACFNLSYEDVMNLPLSLRDAMLDTMQKWRASEAAAAQRHK